MLIPSKHCGYRAGIRLYPGGGKSGGSQQAAAPDPSLVAAQKNSLDAQTQYLNQINANNTAMQPYQMQQMQLGLQASQTAYDQSQQDRTYALGKRDQLSGLQDTMVNQANNYNLGDETNRLVGQAQADSNQAFSNTQAQTSRGLERQGVNPTSGNYQAMQNQNSLAAAANSAQASNMARTAARQEGYQLQDRAANSLSGYPSMGMQTTAAGNTYGTSGISNANSSLAGMNSGNVAGSGVASQQGSNATSMYGAQSNFGLGNAQIAAANNPTNTLLGGLAGGAGAYGMGKMLS